VLVSVRDFFRRQTVIELAGAFAVAWATVSFLEALFRGLVIYPITTAGADYNGSAGLFGHGWVVIGGRLFDWLNPLVDLVVLLLVLTALALLLKATRTHAERPLRECPHCLEDIPAAAPVCSYCTRDVA
jgi:hypothetical protein